MIRVGDRCEHGDESRGAGSLVLVDDERRVSKLRNFWRLALAIIGVIAVIQELRKPPGERTWHGKVAQVVPYDFRMPTMGRVRSTYWNPEGPIISSRVFGVGWAPNFGALAKIARRDPQTAGSKTVSAG
jgi:hypothetical protein